MALPTPVKTLAYPTLPKTTQRNTEASLNEQLSSEVQHMRTKLPMLSPKCNPTLPFPVEKDASRGADQRQRQ